MTDSGDGEGYPGLLRLGLVVQRRKDTVWRAFVVAVTSIKPSRRREMTTQRIFLLGQRNG